MWVVGPVLSDLGSHVGATPTIAFGYTAWLVGCSETPIDYLEVKVGVEADILRLEVTMAEPIVFHVLDTVEKLPRHMPDLTVGERLASDIVEQLAIRCEFLHSVDDLLCSSITSNVLTVLADSIESDNVHMGLRVLQRVQLAHLVLHLTFHLGGIVAFK